VMHWEGRCRTEVPASNVFPTICSCPPRTR
jgi:hypothetical protein